MAELLCLRDRSWLLCRGWPNCFACAIDRGFVDADGRAALRARSIVGLLPRMAEVWLRDPRRLHADPRFAQQKAAFACAIDRGFVAADGRGLTARSPEDCVRIRGLHARSWDYCAKARII